MRSTLLYGVFAFAASSVNARALPGQTLAYRHVFGTPGDCSPQPDGSGPVTDDPDTADAFLANPVYSDGANAASTPDKYSVAYKNQLWASTTDGYLGFEELTSYDTAYCASQCCNSWPGCKSFNIYYERNPTVDPADDCPDPDSTTRIKCSFWTSPLTTSDKKNDGQYCSDFHVVIAGSNGYNSNGVCKSSTTTASAAPTSTGLCPGGRAPDRTVTTSNGAVFGVCLNTDFSGNDLTNTGNIKSPEALAEACSTSPSCVAASVHRDSSIGYLKSVAANANENSGVDSVYQISPGTGKSTTTSSTTKSSTTVATTPSTTAKAPTTSSSTTKQTTTPATTPSTTPAATTPSTTKASTTKVTTTPTTTAATTITACPVPETTYTAKDGSTWAICKGTDYVGQTNQDVNNIYDDNSCAQACSTIAGCVKAVFYPANSVCYIKSTSVSWQVNPKYDTIRQLTGPKPSSLTTCPRPETKYTATDGSTWAICKGTDYKGGNLDQTVSNVKDENACAETCAKATNGCVKAVYDCGSKKCYLKSGSLNWTVDPNLSTVRELTGPTNNGGSGNGGSGEWNTWTQPKKICIFGFCF